MAQQQTLVKTRAMQKIAADTFYRRLQEIDWDFTGQQSHSPFSDLHWHPCRFPSQIPALAISRLSKSSDSILDPFVGSGTTVVEAQHLGRTAVGIDVNPISAMLAKSKTIKTPIKTILSSIDRALLELTAGWDQLPIVDAPATVQLIKWYTPGTQIALKKLWGFVVRSDSVISVVLQAAFSSILLNACRETRHWGYICDNTEPKSNRERDVVASYSRVLLAFKDAFNLRARMAEHGCPKVDIYNGDAATVLRSMPGQKFDCFVTSPPYFGVADYVKSQRLSMEWFGVDIEHHRRQETGARSKRHRRTAFDDYVSELSAVFTEVYRVVRPKSWGLIVYGHSPNRKSGSEELKDSLEKIGFKIELERSRFIHEGRRLKPSILSEALIFVRKP
jgi:DNA modification methylase